MKYGVDVKQNSSAFDMAAYVANSAENLDRAQEGYSRNSDLLATAVEVLNHSQTAYKIVYANYLMENKSKCAMSIIKEISFADETVRAAWEKYMKDEAYVAKLKALIDRYGKEIDTAKHFSNLKQGNYR